MGNKMSKNIKISDIDSAKLLNGEMNSEGVNICNSFAEFTLESDENYDRVIGILEVDSQNKAVLDSNNKPNFKVFINKDGKQYRSKDIVIPHYDDNYNDRLIDTVFPFSEIRKVMIKKYDDDDSVLHEYKTSVSNIEGTLHAYSSELRDEAPYDQFPDTYVEENFRNIKTIDDDGIDSDLRKGFYDENELVGYTPSTYYSMVRIPLFYFRTYFDVSKSSKGKYYRCYEIISEDVYNKLSDKNKTCFSIPKAFYTQDSNHELHKVLYVTSQPISRNGIFNCFGSENNIFEPQNIFGFGFYNSLTSKYSYETPDTIFNEHGMSAEIWYGVICYLMRLYTGSFDLCNIHPDTSNYDAMNIAFNSCIDFLNNDETRAFTFEKVITSDNIADTDSKVLDNSNNLVFTRNCFYGCTNAVFVTSFQDFYDEYSSDYELKKVTVTYIDVTDQRYRYRIDGLNLSDGTYFVSNFIINTNNASSFLAEDKISIGNKCFILTVSSGSYTIKNMPIYGWNDYNKGLKRYVYSESGSIYFETARSNSSNIGISFNLYDTGLLIGTGAYRSNVLEFLFERIRVDGDIKYRAVVNAFIDTDEGGVSGKSTSNAGHWQVIPLVDYDNPANAGLILNENSAISFLKTKIFANYNASTLGTDIIRISTYEHPWSNFGFGIEHNDRMLSCVNKKNAYIGNKLTLMHFSDIFRPFKLQPSMNQSYCFLNTRPSIYRNSPGELSRGTFVRGSGDYDQSYYITINLDDLSKSLTNESYFVFGLKIYDTNSDDVVDFSNALGDRDGNYLILEKTFDQVDPNTGYGKSVWSLKDNEGNTYNNSTLPASNKYTLNADYCLYLWQNNDLESTPHAIGTPRIIIECSNTTKILTTYQTKMDTALQISQLFTGSRTLEKRQSGVFINNMSCNFESGKKLKVKTYDFYLTEEVEFDTVNIATNNTVDKYFMFCDQDEIEANNGTTYTRTPVNDSQGRLSREYYNSDTSFMEIPITNTSNNVSDNTFLNYETGYSYVSSFRTQYYNIPIGYEPDFIFSVGSTTGTRSPMTYSPKPSLYSINMFEVPEKHNYFKWFFRFDINSNNFLDQSSYDYYYKYIYMYRQALMLTFLEDE